MDDNFRNQFNMRKGPDLILKLVDLLSLCLWIMLIINIGVILTAKPVDETFFDRLFNVCVRDYWNFNLLRVALALTVFQFLISVFSLYLNSKRLKREHDRIRVSIIVSIFFSLIICIILSFILFC